MSSPPRPAPDDHLAPDDGRGGVARDRSDWPVRVYRMGEEPPDRDYWLARSPEERWEAVETLRAQHHGWTDETRPQLQRVLRVVDGP